MFMIFKPTIAQYSISLHYSIIIIVTFSVKNWYEGFYAEI